MQQKRFARLKWLFYLYYDGFKNMKTGKMLWLIIAIKLFVLLVILKWLFFPNFLKTRFTNDADRGAYILDELTLKKEK
jgi:hypothetical protein